MKNLKTTLTILVLVISAHSLNAQTYIQGFELGKADAQKTMDMHYRRTTCLSLSNSPGSPGSSPVVYKGCYVLATNEQTFVNFWQGYLTNVKNAYCLPNQAMKEYLRGQIVGYHLQMTFLSGKYSANYYGSDNLPCQ